MKCWNCGAENSNADEYCTSCASALAPRQMDEQIDIGNVLMSLSNAILGELPGAVIRSTLLIGAVAAIALIHDLVTGNEAIAELGTILVLIGLSLIAICSFRNIRTPVKMEVLSRHQERGDRSTRAVHTHPAFWPVWMSARRKPFQDRYSQPLTPFIMGVILVLVGALLL